MTDRPRDSLPMSLFAMAFFLCWGLYINWDHGFSARVQVAFTQGLLGLVTTYFLAELAVWGVQKSMKRTHPVLLAGTLSWSTVYLIVIGVHWLAGTPELFLTVLPGMITGAIFSLGYAKRVHAYFLRS